MVNENHFTQSLILIPDTLKEENDLIIHIKFWKSKIKLVNLVNESDNPPSTICQKNCQTLRDTKTNYEKLVRSIQAVQSYSELWQESLKKIIEYKTTKNALEVQQISNFSSFKKLDVPEQDLLNSQKEMGLHRLRNLEQLQSRIEELEELLYETIKILCRLEKKESYPSQKVWKICRNFCQLTLKEYREIRNQFESKQYQKDSWQFLSLRNELEQTILKRKQLSASYFNEDLDKSSPKKLNDSLKNSEDLKSYLQQEFNYCSCVEGTIDFLKNMLKSMNNIQNNQLEKRRKKNLVKLQKEWESNPFLFTWFIFNLEQKGLIWHGFNITDCWLTDKGGQLLRVLETFSEEDRK